MNTILLAILIVFSLILILILFLVRKELFELKREKAEDKTTEILSRGIEGLHQRLNQASQAFTSLTRELGEMQEIGRNIKEFQDMLRSPKLRGGLGEQGLKDILGQLLPTKLFETQFRFRDGTTVDVIIKLKAGKIPIDAKFPLENFNRLVKAKTENDKQIYAREFSKDFKKHVLDISKRYIQPTEGTVDFAIMYLPIENAYYQVVANEPSLNDLAHHHKIIVASPSTLWVYLRTIMLGLEGERISELSREILASIKVVQNESQKLGQSLGILDRHLTDAKNTMGRVSSDYGRLSHRIESVTLLEEGEEKLIEAKTQSEDEKL